MKQKNSQLFFLCSKEVIFFEKKRSFPFKRNTEFLASFLDSCKIVVSSFFLRLSQRFSNHVQLSDVKTEKKKTILNMPKKFWKHTVTTNIGENSFPFQKRYILSTWRDQVEVLCKTCANIHTEFFMKFSLNKLLKTRRKNSTNSKNRNWH